MINLKLIRIIYFKYFDSNENFTNNGLINFGKSLENLKKINFISLSLSSK